MVDATLAQHLAASLFRVFAALAAALLIEVPAGFAIGLSTVGRGILDPIVEFLRPIPPLAYLPLVIIWAGIGESAKVLVIALAMLPPIILATAAGRRGGRQSAERGPGAGRHRGPAAAAGGATLGRTIHSHRHLHRAGRRRAGRSLGSVMSLARGRALPGCSRKK